MSTVERSKTIQIIGETDQKKDVMAQGTDVMAQGTDVMAQGTDVMAQGTRQL